MRASFVVCLLRLHKGTYALPCPCFSVFSWVIFIRNIQLLLQEVSHHSHLVGALVCDCVLVILLLIKFHKDRQLLCAFELVVTSRPVAGQNNINELKPHLCSKVKPCGNYSPESGKA